VQCVYWAEYEVCGAHNDGVNPIETENCTSSTRGAFVARVEWFKKTGIHVRAPARVRTSRRVTARPLPAIRAGLPRQVETNTSPCCRVGRKAESWYPSTQLS